MFSAFMPMAVNVGLNGFKRVLINGSFADGDGQHFYCIAKRGPGRQRKMQPGEKNCDGGSGRENPAQAVG